MKKFYPKHMDLACDELLSIAVCPCCDEEWIIAVRPENEERYGEMDVIKQDCYECYFMSYGRVDNEDDGRYTPLQVYGMKGLGL